MEIKEGQIFIVKGTRYVGLTPRGRLMRVPFKQTVQFTAPNTYENIILEHMRGPMKGVSVKFSRTKCFRTIQNDTCSCKAYHYPHRKGAGQCQVKTQ